MTSQNDDSSYTSNHTYFIKSEDVTTSNTIDSKEDEGDYSEFSPLSEYDVAVNLKVLSEIKDGEKITIEDGKTMQIDRRYAQFLRRAFTSDSRKKVIKFVRYLVASAKRFCADAARIITNSKNTQQEKSLYLKKLIEYQTDLTSACTGLGRMAITYSDDKQHQAQISTIQREVSTFCNEDLKTITSTKL